MSKRPVRPHADYRAALEDLYRYFGGINVEHRGNATAIAKELNYSPSVMGKIRTFAERIGGMSIRYEAALIVPGEGIKGKHSYWTFLHTPEWMMTQARDKWGFTAFDHSNISHRMPHQKDAHNKWILPGSAPVKETPQLAETELQQPKVADIAEIRREVAEPEALVESIRQYMNREAFIEEELVRFAEMGIEIDREAIKFDSNPEMEFAIPLVELLDKLERQNARLRDRQADTTGANTLRQKNRQLENDLLEARHDRKVTNEAFDTYRADTREKMQKQDRRIKELESLVSDEALKRLNGVARGQQPRQV